MDSSSPTTQTRNILQRMLEVMKKVDYVQKEKKAGMQYTIVSHDKVTALIRPHLVEAGIIYYPAHTTLHQDGNRTEMLVTMRFVNADNPADFIETQTAGYGVDSQDKGPGKAMSYAVKYALLKAFGLETGDDPDEDQKATHVPATVTKPTLELVATRAYGSYDSMSNEEKIATWQLEWKSCKTEAEFTKSVNDLRRIEAEGSPIRFELLLAHKLAASRFAK